MWEASKKKSGDIVEIDGKKFVLVSVDKKDTAWGFTVEISGFIEGTVMALSKAEAEEKAHEAAMEEFLRTGHLGSKSSMVESVWKRDED